MRLENTLGGIFRFRKVSVIMPVSISDHGVLVSKCLSDAKRKKSNFIDKKGGCFVELAKKCVTKQV
jgi:hypothetical protein